MRCEVNVQLYPHWFQQHHLFFCHQTSIDYLKLLVSIRPYLLKHNSPRWVIVLIDLAITTFSVFLAYFLRFGFTFPERYKETFVLVLFLVLFIRTLFFLAFKVFASIVRYTSFLDIRRILLSVSSGTALLLIINYLINSERKVKSYDNI